MTARRCGYPFRVTTPPSGSQSFFLSRGLSQKDGKRSDQMDETQEPRIDHADRQGLELQEITNAMVRLYKEPWRRLWVAYVTSGTAPRSAPGVGPPVICRRVL